MFIISSLVPFAVVAGAGADKVIGDSALGAGIEVNVVSGTAGVLDEEEIVLLVLNTAMII